MRKLAFAVKGLVLTFAMVMFAHQPSFAREGHAAMGAMGATAESPKAESAKVVELRQSLRDLWIDHVFWVRNVALMTRIGNRQGSKVAEEHVVKNARAIADAVSPLYGKPAADKLFGLLAGHYGAVKQYMTASYAGNRAGKGAASQKIRANATEIAGFLSSANPNWPKETLVSLLVAHGGHHMAQIDSFARRDYAAEAQIWEPMKSHMYMIADALADGIAKQFPDKF